MTSLPITFNKVCQESNCVEYSNGADLAKSPVAFDNTKAAKYISNPFLINRLSCLDKNDCYLFLGFVADSFSIDVNGHNITNLIDQQNNYSSHKSVIIPISKYLLSDSQNIIEVDVKDLNTYQWGLLNKDIEITNYHSAQILSIKD